MHLVQRKLVRGNMVVPQPVWELGFVGKDPCSTQCAIRSRIGLLTGLQQLWLVVDAGWAA